MSPSIIGPCYRPTPPFVGIKIRYWEPSLLVETVKSPGDTVINEFAPILNKMLSNASKTLMNDLVGLPVSVTSGSSRQSISGVNLQFNEVHIYNFPFNFEDIVHLTLTCPKEPAAVAPIIYLSELDSAEWRIGFLEVLSPKSLLSASLGPVCSLVNQQFPELCMGAWGSIYPRRGFITHQSEVVASAADVFRGVSAASIEDFGIHKTISQIFFIPDSSRDKLQLVYPFPSGCIKIGQNPVSWESQKKSLDGKYLWIYWRHRECCIF